MTSTNQRSPVWLYLKGCVTFVLIVTLLGACSAPRKPPPVFREIAVIPVSPPESIYTENRMFVLPLVPALIVNSAMNRAKTNEFSAQMDTARRALGPQFTQILIEELKAHGLSAHAYDTVPRRPNAPDNIDYIKLPTQDAILHVWFTDVSMDSARLSSDYVPRMNVDGEFMARRDASSSQYFTFRYGADASNDGKEWNIPSAPKYRFGNFGVLQANSDLVVESWQVAMREMARRIANEVAKAPHE